MFDLSASADPKNTSETLGELRSVVAQAWNRRAQPAEAEGVEVVGFLYKNNGEALTAADMDADTFALMARSDFGGEVEKLVRQSDHLAALSAVTAERDALAARLGEWERSSLARIMRENGELTAERDRLLQKLAQAETRTMDIMVRHFAGSLNNRERERELDECLSEGIALLEAGRDRLLEHTSKAQKHALNMGNKALAANQLVMEVRGVVYQSYIDRCDPEAAGECLAKIDAVIAAMAEKEG
ncbi:hypothetical protein B597_019665 [Stutzerimonas stutzeri KOS6]|uniref:Uncharacterized protein n=2 Tax=Stutzerimonas stutzeri TaxID=316 RepID=A0A061JJV6_STUST|nr:hypothetical protein B597_019665 [Stutzerimonas stutzeri KOS6]